MLPNGEGDGTVHAFSPHGHSTLSTSQETRQTRSLCGATPVARTQPVSSYQSVHKLSQVLGFALAALRLPHVVAAFFGETRVQSWEGCSG